MGDLHWYARGGRQNFSQEIPSSVTHPYGAKEARVPAWRKIPSAVCNPSGIGGCCWRNPPHRCRVHFGAATVTERLAGLPPQWR
jgi:hypothetical protein